MQDAKIVVLVSVEDVEYVLEVTYAVRGIQVVARRKKGKWMREVKSVAMATPRRTMGKGREAGLHVQCINSR